MVQASYSDDVVAASCRACRRETRLALGSEDDWECPGCSAVGDGMELFLSPSEWEYLQRFEVLPGLS